MSLFDLKDVHIDKFDIDKIKIPYQLPLGKRVEYFFDAMIEQSSNYKIVLKNLQIIQNKNTFGELDFIVFSQEQKRYVHVEMQYKFYLYDECFEEEIHRYIGPNRNDTLYLKLEKLKNRQLPLLYKEETKAFLGGIDISKIEQKVLFQANIFLPRTLQIKTLPLIDNRCICGYYLSFNEFIFDTSFLNYEFCLPHRFDWLNNPNTNERWKNYDETKGDIEFFINQKSSPLVWSKRVLDDEMIIERFFITWW